MTKDETEKQREYLLRLHTYYWQWFDSGKYVIDSIEWMGTEEITYLNAGIVQNKIGGTMTMTVHAHKQIFNIAQVIEQNKEAPHALLS